MNVKPFFDYARERHQIYLRRSAGDGRPWTENNILDTYRFTNVFRELDKTTVWFRKHARDPMKEEARVVLATVVFRLLNRIQVGEAIFGQGTLERGNNETPFDIYCEEGDVRVLKRAIKALMPTGPYVTGAYIISSPAGLPKLDGMLKVIDTFNKKSNWREEAAVLQQKSLEDAWLWFKQFRYFGQFHSYEIVTDLRHTCILRDAPDLMSWANIGPGCRRGLNRLLYGKKTAPKKLPDNVCLLYMKEILEASRSMQYWPTAEWPAWEMRDVEHTLCEFDKYQRVLKKEGRPRGVYK